MELLYVLIFFAGYTSILIFLILSIIYTSTLFFSAHYKVPFVGSRRHKIRALLQEINPQPGAIFYDLGSGDGRIVREASDYFKLNATGFEINPMLVWFSKFRAKQAQSQAQFIRANILNVELEKAEIIYVFLLTFMLEDMTHKFQSECSKGTIIISHGFKISKLASKLYKTIEDKPFSTYYYRL